MLEQLTYYGDLGLWLLRMALAIIFAYHGLPKLKNYNAMAQAMSFSPSFVLALGFVEVIAAIGLVFGFFTQWFALLLAIDMVGAIYYKTAKWNIAFSALDKTGWEFDLILLAASITILLTGGGAIQFF